jgi:hypothetical protein
VGWVTISALATAAGTLVLAVATFASVKSANRAARVAERALFVGLRPLLVPSRFEDPEQKVGFADRKWLKVPGGEGVAEASDEAIHLAISLRNPSSGIALLHGWKLYVGRGSGSDEVPDPATFTRQTRDIYIAAGDVGFWQGVYRDPAVPEFAPTRAAIDGRDSLTVDLLYGDLEGGQRLISRFVLDPRQPDASYVVSVGRHWNLDRPDPR